MSSRSREASSFRAARNVGFWRFHTFPQFFRIVTLPQLPQTAPLPPSLFRFIRPFESLISYSRLPIAIVLFFFVYTCSELGGVAQHPSWMTFPPSPNAHGIISFTDPHPLTPIESYPYKNGRGEGVPSPKPKAFIAPRSISLSAPYLFPFLRRVPNGRRNAWPL